MVFEESVLPLKRGRGAQFCQPRPHGADFNTVAMVCHSHRTHWKLQDCEALVDRFSSWKNQRFSAVGWCQCPFTEARTCRGGYRHEWDVFVQGRKTDLSVLTLLWTVFQSLAQAAILVPAPSSILACPAASFFRCRACYGRPKHDVERVPRVSSRLIRVLVQSLAASASLSWRHGCAQLTGLAVDARTF